MPSDKPTQSKINHAVLGPGIAVFDDRGRTRLRLLLWIVMVPLGIYGVWLGRGDVVTGSAVPGLAQALAGIILAGYSLRAAVVDVRRLSQPILMVIARDGFALVPGDRTISWSEVESVGDTRSPADQPRNLRVQLADPGEFVHRHHFSPLARLALRLNRGDLVLGSGMAMGVAKAQTLMRQHLADFHGPASARAAAPVRARVPGHRSGRKR